VGKISRNEIALPFQPENFRTLFVKDEEGRETAELFTKLDTWDKDRRKDINTALTAIMS